MNGLDERNENRDGQIFLFTLFSLLQEVLQHPQLALGLLIDAERKAAVVRVKREGEVVHFWNGDVQLQRRPALCRYPPDFTARGTACLGDDVTAVPRPLQGVTFRQTVK